MSQQTHPIKTYGSLRQYFVQEAGKEIYLASHQSRESMTAVCESNKAISKEFKGTTKQGTAITARVPVIYRYIKWPAEFEARYGVRPEHFPGDMKMSRRMEIQALWADFYKKKLNDRDYRDFRTDGGRRL